MTHTIWCSTFAETEIKDANKQTSSNGEMAVGDGSIANCGVRVVLRFRERLYTSHEIFSGPHSCEHAGARPREISTVTTATPACEVQS